MPHKPYTPCLFSLLSAEEILICVFLPKESTSKTSNKRPGVEQ